MNFLSHYYFDRDTTNCYHILGTVLPDLLKNADKSIIIHPEKLHHQKPEIEAIISGWKKHLEVDRYFHSSEFFIIRSHHLKNLLIPAIEGSPVKPFFLGHIALELLLDNLLLTTGKVVVGDFYDHLNSCDEMVIDEFLTFSGLNDTSVFFRFYEKFKNSRYLDTYSDTQQVAYALKRICMRVWNNPFTAEQEGKMNWVLSEYRNKIFDDFMMIFDEIVSKLIPDIIDSFDQDNIPKESKKYLGVNDRPFIHEPERHGCVTAWLIMMIVVSAACILLYAVLTYLMEQKLKMSIYAIMLLITLLVLNIVFAFKLLAWKKAGFYGLIITTTISSITNMLLNVPLLVSLIGCFSGVAILYGILQIKKGGVSTWRYLK